MILTQQFLGSNLKLFPAALERLLEAGAQPKRPTFWIIDAGKDCRVESTL